MVESSKKFAAHISGVHQSDFLALVQKEVDPGRTLYRVWYTDPASQRWCRWVSENAFVITPLEFVEDDIVQICWENNHIEALEVAVLQYRRLEEEKKRESDWSFPLIEYDHGRRFWAAWPVEHCDVERLNRLPLFLKEYFRRPVKWSDYVCLREHGGEDHRLVASLVHAHLQSREDVMLLVVISTVNRKTGTVFSLLGWDVMEMVFKMV